MRADNKTTAKPSLNPSHQSADNNHNHNDDDACKLSSADTVDRHLQQLEQKNTTLNQRPLSPEEQLFTQEELARLINPDKLKVLMESGDDLVGYLTSEIDKFED